MSDVSISRLLTYDELPTTRDENGVSSRAHHDSRSSCQLTVNSHVNRTRTVSAIGYMVNQNIKLLGHWLTSWHTPLWGCKCLISIKLELFGLQSFLGRLSLPPLRVLSEVTHWHPTENEKRANFSSRCTFQRFWTVGLWIIFNLVDVDIRLFTVKSKNKWSWGTYWFNYSILMWLNKQ